MMEKKLKKPPVDAGKHLSQPEPSASGSTQNQKPTFSFEHLRKGYCISDCVTEEKAALADRLREMSQLTWAQLQSSHRHGQGCETIARTSIKGDAVPSHLTPDVKLLSFRFSGLKAMVGYRENRVFVVLWIDREFNLYKH